ncbi:hypothetical protein [Neptunomonas phycophila]|uniref:hypothetical protein n=1 Tax=Neptunomonas phycophila TaxID=1572645 RepID=UPI003518F724
MLTDTVTVLRLLVDQNRQLEQAIRHEAHSFWMPGIAPEEDEKQADFFDPSLHPEAIDHLIAVLTGIEFVDGQDGRATQKQKGIILIGNESLRIASQINTTKTQLKTMFAAIPKQGNTPLRDLLNERAEIRAVLHYAGIGRLCINQATRLLPIVDHAPLRVSWTERLSTSIKRISIEDACRKLDKLTSAQADIDRDLLSRLKRNTPLAIVQVPNNPTLKANIFRRAIVEGEITVTNKSIHAPMPIICQTGHELPRLNKGGTRATTQRSDKKIADKPYLASIRAHLYLTDTAGS